MKPTPKLSDAVKESHREALEAVRDRLAAALDDNDRPPHTTAPLARQLQSVLRELAEMPDAHVGSVVEALQARRASRLLGGNSAPRVEVDPGA